MGFPQMGLQNLPAIFPRLSCWRRSIRLIATGAFPGRLKGVIAIQEESRPKGCRLSSILSCCFGETACEESTEAFSACSHALEHRAGKLKAVR